jgi:exodeoxyribonuclease VIII
MKRDYLSVSALKAFQRSPNHYLQYVTAPRPGSKAMILGKAIHCAVLEPEEFDKRYAVQPKLDRRTKAGKQAAESFAAAQGDREIITGSDHETLVLVRRACEQDPHSADLLRRAKQFEETRTENIQGVPFKGIADIVGKTYVADLKTTMDASPEGFAAAAGRMGYHLQASAYRELFGVDRFFWIAVETSPPYNVVVYEQGENSHRKAQKLLHKLINRWKAWDGRPASYSTEVCTLELPHWM